MLRLEQQLDIHNFAEMIKCLEAKTQRPNYLNLARDSKSFENIQETINPLVHALDNLLGNENFEFLGFLNSNTWILDFLQCTTRKAKLAIKKAV